MIVLGIETSCDETAAAIVDDGRRILGQRILSQLDQHAPYGGVVPEIAARTHIDHLDRLIGEAMEEAGISFAALDGIAATAGPGLIGGVLVGLVTAKAIALAAGKPLIAVNHLEGHALTARLTDDVPFPYLLLLVSGGHCQILWVEGVGRYRRLGTTIDDALGEAFDKTAKMLGIGYPGGPAIEALAGKATGPGPDLPRPMTGRPGCDFSFSGLKTAVRQAVERLDDPGESEKAAIASAFQEAAIDCVIDRLGHALETMAAEMGSARRLVVAGGVAANRRLKERLQDLARDQALQLTVPPPALCTDNGAMIAWAGLERLRLGLTDDYDIPARARWPLDGNAAPARGAGVKA